MKKIKILVAAITVFAMALALIGCGGGDKAPSPADSEVKETIKIAYLPITHALPVFAAKNLADQGKIPSNVNIEMVKFSSWAELTDALNTGRVDGASVLIELALKSKEQGIDLKLAALGHHDGNVVIVKPEISAAGDLKGKTIAIPHRQSSHNILVQQVLENAGLKVSDVTIVELPPSEMPSALAQGQIDAYCVAEPFGAKGVTLGAGKALYESNELWEDSLCCGLVLNGAYVEAHPQTAGAYVDQYLDAGNYLAANADAATAVAKDNLSVDDDTLALSLKWISYADLRVTEGEYESLIEKMVKFGITDNPPKYADFVATALR